MDNINKKGLLLVFLTAVISGFSIFINKYSVEVINPYVFTFLKNAFVAIGLTGFILLAKDWETIKKLNKKQWGLLVLIGFIGGSIPFLLFFKGLSLTNAAQGSFIQKTMFIYVIIIAVLFLKESFNKKILIGALFLLLGNILLLKTLPYSFGRGDFLILLATFLWAVENVISKYILKSLPGKIVAWGRMFFGLIFIFIYLLFSGQLAALGALNIQQIKWVIITAILLFAYVMTWYSGLKYVPVSVATSVLLIGSPITTLLSLVTAGKVSSKEIISLSLILIGVILVLGFKHFFQQIKKFKEKIYVRA